MEYEEQNSTGLLKQSAMQIMTWNQLAPPGLTSRVFFDYILHDFDAWHQAFDGWVQDSDHWHRRFFVTKIDSLT